MSIIINGSTTLAGPTVVGPVQPLLLDTYTGAPVAFSLRKLRTAYTGAAIRVRRSSDNAESDIGFDVSGNLDENALTTFVSSGDGFITTWYDQTGNLRHATQTTNANQPLIVSAGVVNKKNSRPAINYNASTCKLQLAHSLTYNYSSTNYLSIFFAFSGTKNNTTPRLLDKDNGAGNRLLMYCTASNGNPNTLNNSVTSTISTDSLTGSLVLLTSINNANSQMFLNSTISGTAVSLSGVSVTNLNVMYFGATSDNTRTMLGNFSEFILYNSDQSSNRSGIENNINQYYNIY